MTGDVQEAPGPVPTTPTPGTCPACSALPLRTLVEFDAPIHTSVLLDSRSAAQEYPRGTIRLELCERCGFITNTAFDAPHHDYSASYEETQAFSPRFLSYATGLAATLTDRHDLAGRDVLEIGCGRADFLALLCEATGGAGVGIDPSWKGDLPDRAGSERVRVIRSFFAPDQVDRSFGLVACRHTLEHVHDVNGFLTSLSRALEPYPDTPVVFEVPDTLRILRESAFWDVFYEHCSYFTPGSMARAFRRGGFGPERVELTFDDQYILLTALPAGSVGAAATALHMEEPPGEVLAAAERFVRDVDRSREAWTERLRALHRAGRRAVIWGAGSKAVGFLSAIGLDQEIACLVDVNPAKHGMFLPGTGHEIIAPEQVPDVQPEVVIVMNPAYRDEITASIRALGLDAQIEVLDGR
jgi:SAM-dependent methyltransferase